MSVNEKMTAIADAIRAKTGETGLLSLDAMAAAIMGISVGSGGSEDSLQFTTGTFTANTTRSAVTINHSLGKKPIHVIFFTTSAIFIPSYNATNSESVYQSLYSWVNALEDGNFSYSSSYVYTSRMTYYSSASATTASHRPTHSISINSKESANNIGSANYSINNITDESFTTPAYLYAGKTYRWFAIGEGAKTDTTNENRLDYAVLDSLKLG